MIYYVKGNMFDKAYDVRINTVNCVGVMGAGLALEFKKRYPKMFDEYKHLCNTGSLGVGKLHSFRADDCLIVNFPTKDHWKNDSKMEYIEAGLRVLRPRMITWDSSTTCAMVRLGCGIGKLDWNDVRPLIEKHLGDLPLTIDVYL